MRISGAAVPPKLEIFKGNNSNPHRILIFMKTQKLPTLPPLFSSTPKTQDMRLASFTHIIIPNLSEPTFSTHYSLISDSFSPVPSTDDFGYVSSFIFF